MSASRRTPSKKPSLAADSAQRARRPSDATSSTQKSSTKPVSARRSGVEGLLRAAQMLREAVARIRISPPVTHVYNPLEYAWAAHRQYIEKFGGMTGRVVLLGMNPGPFGMAQTGVPFGEVRLVRDWMGIVAKVGRPAKEHPARPVLGFDCPRREVSGARLWGWAKQRFTTPEAFFASFYVVNYCPLVFMEESGRNRTPDRLAAGERVALFEACDAALRETITCLQPKYLIGVGGFAYKRAQQAVAGLGIPVGQILHPSPANPKANADWVGTVEAQLESLGVL